MHSIPDDRFIDESMRNSMLEWYVGAKKINTSRSLFRKYKAHTTEIRKFGLNFPGIKSINKLPIPSGTTQLAQMQIKMMRNQEEMFVLAYGIDTYKSMILGLMNGLPGLSRQQMDATAVDREELDDDDNDDDKLFFN